ncbi:MAG: glutathione S-transferase family protein [Leptospira sp.]|nr:glutathione S-transferase family protein [Leptospira sp.]
MKIYGDEHSGNSYKVKLTCHLMDIPYKWVPIDILKGETKTKEFLALNANGKIPLIELDNGNILSESNAIINYLAHDSHLLPKDRFLYYKAQQWQFFEQYSHEPYIAVARFIRKYQGIPESRKEEYLSKQSGGYKALSVMEDQLTKEIFFVGDSFSVADISLYAYTHVAHEGGFDLEKFPAIKAWFKRVEAIPRFVSM